jgi:hypothetical protein
LEWHDRRHYRRIKVEPFTPARYRIARRRPAAAVLGKTLKKRAVPAATDPSGLPPQWPARPLMEVKSCRRRRVWRRLKPWQDERRGLALKKQFFAAPILLERIIRRGASGRASLENLGKTLEERSRRCVTLAFKAFGRGLRKWVTSW